MERVERHVQRLRRDAARLGLPLPSARAVERLLIETAVATFARGNGIIRVEWSHAENQEPELLAIPRPIGIQHDTWIAAHSKAIHPGPEHRRNTKFVSVDAYDVARDEVYERDLDEVLLFDGEGLLVEGSRSNILMVRESGQLVTPARELGGVEGLGLTIVLENRAEITFARLTRDDVAHAREMMSVNAVRGVVSIIEIDGHPVGDGRRGVVAQQLGHLFESR